MKMTITAFGRELHNPVLKIFWLFIIFVYFLFLVVCSPILVPAHFILRKFGLNGFYFDNQVSVGWNSFKRYEEPFDLTTLGFRHVK